LSTSAVSAYLFLLDSAFESSRWHSLVGNLKSLKPEDWTWIPPEGDRSIQLIVEHIGVCKIMYENHAFGDAKLSWDDQLVEDESVLWTIPSAIRWLRDCNSRWRTSVAALTDEELLRPRKAHWGEMKETRFIISAMIEHDTYHAGEINLLRSLHGGENSRDGRDYARSIRLAQLSQIVKDKP
jgi:uncharacterized damage-inducible protein DinB